MRLHNKMIVASALAIAAGDAAVAQDANELALPEEGVPDIVVTAERRESTVQKTAIAISAFDQSLLDDLSVQNLDNLANFVPSLIFSQENSEFKVIIRGVGSDNLNINGSNGVAIHVDGIPLSRPSGFNAASYDVERIEILRGPQGTLYGRNATGGAINLISALPSKDIEASADILYGDYEWIRFRTAANLPITDYAAARMTYVRENRGGVQRNLFPGGTQGGGIDSEYFRGQLRLDPTEDLRLVARASILRQGGTGPSRKRLSAPPNSPLIDAGFVTEDPDFYTVYKDTPEFQRVELDVYSLEATWDLPFATLTVLGGHVESLFRVQADADQVRRPLGIAGGQTSVSRAFTDSTQDSVELRLASRGDGPVEWLIGAFMLDEEVDYELLVSTQRTGPPNFPVISQIVNNIDSVDTRSWAVFGQASYSFGANEQFKLAGGLRYTTDKREGVGDDTQTFRRPGPGGIGSNRSLTTPAGSWDKITWRAAADWQVTPTNLLYASASTGFKSGGFNFGARNADEEYYDPESLTAYEIGSKNRFFDGRAQLNLSTFYYDYKDLQAFQILEDQSFVENAATATVYGVELEGTLRPFGGLSLDGHLSWQRARFNSFRSRDAVFPNGPDNLSNTGDELIDLSGNRLQNAPDWSGHIGAQYAIPVGGTASLILRAQTYFQSKAYVRTFNRDPYDRQDAYTKTDLNVRLENQGDLRWFIGAGVDNVEDEAVISSIDVTATGRYFANVRDPRLWHVTAGIAF